MNIDIILNSIILFNIVNYTYAIYRQGGMHKQLLPDVPIYIHNWTQYSLFADAFLSTE